MSLKQADLMPFLPGQPLLVAFDGAPLGADSFQIQATHTWSNGASTTDDWSVQSYTQDPNSALISLVVATIPPTSPQANDSIVDPAPIGGDLFLVTSALYACMAEAANPAFCTEAGIGMILIEDLELCATPTTAVNDPAQLGWS